MIAAIVFCAAIAGLALFQAALIAGAPLGRLAWGGQHRILPRRLRVGSVISIGLYALFALIVLDRAGVWQIAAFVTIRPYATWVLMGYFLLGVVMNGISRSPPERLAMTPLAAVLAVCCFVVAQGPN